MNEYNEKTSIVVRNTIAILCCFMFIIFYLWGDVCTDHDHWYIYTEDYSSGRILSILLCRFFYILIPQYFHIHINDVSAYIVPTFNAIMISVSALFMLKIYYFFSKEQTPLINRKSFFILYPLCFIISAIIPSISIEMDVFYFSGIASTLRYYDHVFNFVFFVIFIYSLIKIIFSDTENTLTENNANNDSIEKQNLKFKNNIILYLLNALFLGFSTEMLIIISNFICFFSSIYLGINYLKDKSKLYKKYLVSLITLWIPLFIGSVTTFLLSSYSKGKLGGYADNNLFQDIINIEDQIIPFMQCYFKFIINENIINIIIILLLNILIHFIIKNKKINKKINIIQSIILGSCLFFFLLLIFLGNSNNAYQFDYWVEYWPIRMLWGKILVLNILFITGYIIYNLQSNKKVFYTFLIMLFCYLMSYIGIYTKEAIWEYEFQICEMNILRSLLYETDKMSLLYSNMDGIALLPITDYDKYGFHTSLFRANCFDVNGKILNQMLSLSQKEIDNEKSRIFTVIEERNEKENEYLSYLRNSYNINLDGIIFINDHLADKEFIRRGGKFSDKELESLHFSNIKNSKEFNVSLDILNKKIQENPELEFLYAAKGRLLLKDKKYDEAIKEFKKAISKSNPETPYYLLLANAYLEKGDINNAIKNYNKVIELYPYSLNIMAKTASLYIQTHNYKKANELYLKLINIFPYVPFNQLETYYNELAYTEYKLKNYLNALDYLQKYEEINPKKVAYLLKACVQINLNNLKEASKDIEKVEFAAKEDAFLKNLIEEIKQECISKHKCSVY